MVARRTFLQALAAAPALSLSAAEGELRVAVNRTTIESAPLLLEPIPNVTIVPVENGRMASAQLVSGMVDVATGSETRALLNSVAQPDLRIVLTLSECRYRMVARRSAGIQGGASLRGKRIAATAGTSSLYFLVAMLRSAGLAQEGVTVVPMEGPAMPEALAKGEIDAMAMWEPHAQNAIDRLGADAMVWEDPSGYVEHFNLNTTTAVLANPEKRELLGELVRRVRGISTRLEQSPERYLPALARAIATPEAVIERAWKQFRFPAALDRTKLIGMLQQMEPWAAEVAQRQPRNALVLATLVDGTVVGY